MLYVCCFCVSPIIEKGREQPRIDKLYSAKNKIARPKEGRTPLAHIYIYQQICSPQLPCCVRTPAPLKWSEQPTRPSAKKLVRTVCRSYEQSAARWRAKQSKAKAKAKGCSAQNETSGHCALWAEPMAWMLSFLLSCVPFLWMKIMFVFGLPLVFVPFSFDGEDGGFANYPPHPSPCVGGKMKKRCTHAKRSLKMLNFRSLLLSPWKGELSFFYFKPILFQTHALYLPSLDRKRRRQM